MDIISKVKALNLPDRQYIVFGSGPLAVYGIRDTGDIDLFVSSELYQKLISDGWEEKSWDNGGKYLRNDNVEVDDSWDYGDYNPSLSELIERAISVQGIPFASLEDVLQWKKAFGRPKDLADIKLIEAYLAKK